MGEDPLTEVLRRGDRQLLVQTLEAEIESFLTVHAHIKDDGGNRRVVRNGYGPERKIQTGIGEVAVHAPKATDRRNKQTGKVKFNSTILPPYLRRT